MRKPTVRSPSVLLERLDELDQRQRVGVEVVDERLALGDGRRVDLEDVGEAVADDLEDLVAFDGACSGLGWHGTASLVVGTGQRDDRRAVDSGVAGDGGADLADHVVLDHVAGDADAVGDRRLARTSRGR